MMQRNKPIVRFYMKFLLLVMPLPVLVGLYIHADPFMVIRSYEDYDHSIVCQNEGTVGWMKYKKQRDSQHYDAFLMGTSCTMSISCADWNQYIHAHPFRFFSNAEGLGDLCLKLEALDRQPHQPVRHLLIVAERYFFEKPNPQGGIMHVMPADVSHKSPVSIQTAYLQGFFSPEYLFPYLKYQLTGRYDRSMNGIINTVVPTRTRWTNDAVLHIEDSVRLLGERFWTSPNWVNIKQRGRKVTVAPRVIVSEQMVKLRQIRDFCRRHQTDVNIIVCPSYDLEQLHPQDIESLHHVFGQNHVFDFTRDTSMTDYHYYYDRFHFRPLIGQRILRTIAQTAWKDTKTTPR